MDKKLGNWILGGLLAAVVVGFIPGAEKLVPWVSWLGVLFKQGLLMVIYPLVFATMVCGVLALGELRSLGTLGARTAGYFMGTTALALLLGLLLVNLIQPGVGADLTLGTELPTRVSAASGQSLYDFFLEMIRTAVANPFWAFAEGKVLGIIVFAIVLGLAIIAVGEPAKPIATFMEGANLVMLRITTWVLWLAPAGVFALLLPVIAEGGFSALSDLGRYAFTVVLALLIHGFITLPIVLMVFGRMSPRRFYPAMREALVLAFTTSSSSATLPATLKCTREGLGVPRRVSEFVVPLGSTMNMDGTALYEAIAALFVAQALLPEPLGLVQQVVVFITAGAAAVGAAGIPSAGLVTMVLVFEAVGLPVEAIGGIIAIDRVLDMGRTTVNVMGDAIGSVVVSRWEGISLEPATDSTIDP